MLKFDLYAIYTEDNEYGGSIKEFFSSFEEAMENRMNYANWWCPNGTVWIKKYPANRKEFYASERWYINADGTIDRHYCY